jgi:hypothetical protein
MNVDGGSPGAELGRRRNMVRRELRITGLGLLSLGWGLTSLAAAADPPPSIEVATPVCSMDQLVRMSRCELEALYRGAAVAPVPDRFVPGRAIFSPGSPKTVRAAKMTRVLWQGKEFRCDGTMINHVFGLKAVRANVFYGPSWFDGGPAVVLDYAGMSKLFDGVRDEVREVAPGLYLGLTYLRSKPCEPAMFFTLDARRPCHP